MTFKPAPINYGYAFTRVDLEGSPIIEATANYVVTTQRGTNLEKNGVHINTSEHVLAAAYALGLAPSNGPDISDGIASNGAGVRLSQRISRCSTALVYSAGYDGTFSALIMRKVDL